MMNKKIMIQTKTISKTFVQDNHRISVLNNISLEIYAGDYVAIMGQSGSGKSTLLNILGCIDKQDSGQYFLDGCDISNFKPDDLATIRNHKIGFIFQNFYLIPRMSVLENVALPLVYRGVKSTERVKLATDLLMQIGMADYLAYLPNRLSGGQKQRVAIARAMITDPDVLLADEPTGNLDLLTSMEIVRLFENFNKSGKTLIVVTHAQWLAKRAQRTLYLNQGVINEAVFAE